MDLFTSWGSCTPMLALAPPPLQLGLLRIAVLALISTLPRCSWPVLLVRFSTECAFRSTRIQTSTARRSCVIKGNARSQIVLFYLSVLPLLRVSLVTSVLLKILHSWHIFKAWQKEKKSCDCQCRLVPSTLFRLLCSVKWKTCIP